MSNSIYFPGLNGLRFFSALAVIITHVELIKDKFGFDNCWHNVVIHNLGVTGVSFFFVLSGFLITYLMLLEKTRFGKISIKNFYIRRILRIWPLYFLILIFGFFILPNFTHIPYFSEKFAINFYENLTLYLLILPNIAFSIYPAVPLIGQSWSIGVEEQFYVLWPLFFVLFKNFSVKLLLIFLTLILLIKVFVLHIYLNNQPIEWLLAVKKFLAMSKFENMIIGAIGAICLLNKMKIINLICNNIALATSLVGLVLTTIYLPNVIRDGMHIIHSLFFIVIILNVSSNSKSFLKLENKVLNFLGRISYGIYMYHLIIIYFTFKCLNYTTMSFNSFLPNFMLYAITIAVTIFVSYLSYTFIEKKFLTIKSRF
jgi:peptidoglycan/LPS O-acetylase OafA/YrhL